MSVRTLDNGYFEFMRANLSKSATTGTPLCVASCLSRYVGSGLGRSLVAQPFALWCDARRREQCAAVVDRFVVADALIAVPLLLSHIIVLVLFGSQTTGNDGTARVANVDVGNVLVVTSARARELTLPREYETNAVQLSR